MVAFKILVFFASLKEESSKRSISESREYFYQGYFRQYFAGCSRVSSFHLNHWDNEGDSE